MKFCKCTISNCSYYTGKYKQKCTYLHESFAHERDRIALNEVNELNEVRKALEKQCNQLQNTIFEQNKKIEDGLMQTKIRNAANIYSIVYLVWRYFIHYTVLRMLIVQNSFRKKIPYRA